LKSIEVDQSREPGGTCRVLLILSHNSGGPGDVFSGGALSSEPGRYQALQDVHSLRYCSIQLDINMLYKILPFIFIIRKGYAMFRDKKVIVVMPAYGQI
jgi:hypothetical protein